MVDKIPDAFATRICTYPHLITPLIGSMRIIPQLEHPVRSGSHLHHHSGKYVAATRGLQMNRSTFHLQEKAPETYSLSLRSSQSSAFSRNSFMKYFVSFYPPPNMSSSFSSRYNFPLILLTIPASHPALVPYTHPFVLSPLLHISFSTRIKRGKGEQKVGKDGNGKID